MTFYLAGFHREKKIHTLTQDNEESLWLNPRRNVIFHKLPWALADLNGSTSKKKKIEELRLSGPSR